MRQLVRRVGVHIRAAMADRDVAGAVGRGRQADAGQPGDDAVDAVGLGVDRDMPCAVASAIQRSSAASSVTVSYFERSTVDLLGAAAALGSSAPLPP